MGATGTARWGCGSKGMVLDVGPLVAPRHQLPLGVRPWFELRDNRLDTKLSTPRRPFSTTHSQQLATGIPESPLSLRSTVLRGPGPPAPGGLAA